MNVKVERAAWITAVAVLMAALWWTYSAHRSLSAAVLAGEFERPYASTTLQAFSKEQGVAQTAVLRDFYLMHVGLSTQSCIGVVPKQHVTGGATTYCYTKTSPPRLISVDREGE